MTTLPTSEDLRLLTVRAVVSYVARTVRRVTLCLPQVIPAHLIEDALHRIEVVATVYNLGELCENEIFAATKAVTDEFASLPSELISPRDSLIVMSIVQASFVASHAIGVADNPAKAHHHLARAAHAAVRAVGIVNTVHEDAFRSAALAAQADYETLLSAYGRHVNVTIGEPVDCFEDGA